MQAFETQSSLWRGGLVSLHRRPVENPKIHQGLAMCQCAHIFSHWNSPIHIYSPVKSCWFERGSYDLLVSKVFQVDRLKLAMANLDHRRYRVMIGDSWCGDRWATRLGQAARVFHLYWCSLYIMANSLLQELCPHFAGPASCKAKHAGACQGDTGFGRELWVAVAGCSGGN